VLGRTDLDASARNGSNTTETMLVAVADASTPAEFARCLLRLANLPNFALDRLSRYEAALSRQAGRILFALEALNRRKPQERRRMFWSARHQNLPKFEGD
jgi:hypothetical protein